MVFSDVTCLYLSEQMFSHGHVFSEPWLMMVTVLNEPPLLLTIYNHMMAHDSK